MSAATYSIAVVLSLLMHGLIIFLMSYGWQHQPAQLEIRQPLQVVKASLVELEAKAPPKAPEREVIDLTAQRQREVEERARQEAERKRIDAEKQAKEEAEKKRLEEEKREKELEEERQREEAERLVQEEAERRRIEEFNDALSEEEGYEANIASQELVASVSSLIRQKVGQQWNSPPSARRGMVATVSVTMVPTGRIVQVDIVESNGNAAFDLAVIQAVQKAQPFESVKTLDPAVFEQNFREFRFRFDPQNLRL